MLGCDLPWRALLSLAQHCTDPSELDALLQNCRTKVPVKSSQNMLKLNAMSNSQMSEAASASPKVKQMDAESAVEDCSDNCFSDLIKLIHTYIILYNCFERKSLLKTIRRADGCNMMQRICHMWIMNEWIYVDLVPLLEEWKSKKGLEMVKVVKGRNTWYVTS